jgi:hypothetical protein
LRASGTEKFPTRDGRGPPRAAHHATPDYNATTERERRWVELTFLAVRLGGTTILVLFVPSPEKAVAFLAVQLAVFGFYMGASFAPNHIGMPLVSPKLKLDFLRRQVLMSRNVSGGRFIAISEVPASRQT